MAVDSFGVQDDVLIMVAFFNVEPRVGMHGLHFKFIKKVFHPSV
jgi:hypothetical protein